MTGTFYVLWEEQRSTTDDLAYDAGADEGYPKYHHELKFTPRWMPDREPLRYEFRHPSAQFLDAVPSINGMTLYSSRARDVLEAGKGERDAIQWIPALLRHTTGEERQYWVLHTPEPPDILDSAASTWAGPGRVIRWVLDGTKLGGLHVFRWFQGGMSTVLISEQVWDALQAAGLTGMEVKRARVS